VCDVSISGSWQLQISTYQVGLNSEICVNTSASPFFLIFADLPNTSRVLFYRLMYYEGPLQLDYVSFPDSLNFAVRSLAPNASYTIQPTETANYVIGTVTAPFCSDGITIARSANTSFTFRSGPDFQLHPNDNKCFLIVNSHPSKVRATLNLSAGGDFLMRYRNLTDIESHTGSGTYTFDTNGTSQPILFRLLISHQDTPRFVTFSVESESSTEPEMFVEYGASVMNVITPFPSPAVIFVEVSGVHPVVLGGLIAAGSIFVILFLFAAARYRWVTEWCGAEFCPSRSESPPMLPSAFVGHPPPRTT
jgi:hypothetical protein